MLPRPKFANEPAQKMGGNMAIGTETTERQMKRAAILIGVHQVEGLPKLFAVLDGVANMEAWALAQGMERALVRTITDEKTPVRAEAICDAVEQVLATDGLEQLILYFAGHGVNVSYSEYWLLSKALTRANESVNVDGSLKQARSCGVRHVVLLSDACRTSARTVQEHGTTGTIIFPIAGAGARSSEVDIFYATELGAPAHEIEDTTKAANGFRAVYTDCVLEALSGKHREVREPDSALGNDVVRPWPLKECLEAIVPERLHELTKSFSRNQVPDAIISSNPKTRWVSDLAKIKTEDVLNKRFGDPTTTIDITHPDRNIASALRIDRNLSTDFLNQAVRNERWDFDASIRNLQDLQESLQSSEQGPSIKFPTLSPDLASPALASSVKRNARRFGPSEFESGCGFRVRGATIREVYAGDGTPILHRERHAVRIDGVVAPTSLLMILGSGHAFVTAALPEYIGSLTIDHLSIREMGVADFYYEPSSNTTRWSDNSDRNQELHHLRAVVGAACNRGNWRMNPNDSETMKQRIHLAKGIDPTLGLYTAQACADMGDVLTVDEILESMRADFGKVPLDLAILAGKLQSIPIAPVDWTVPFLPMLARTWALLPAHRLALPKELESIQRHLVTSSFWSLYQPTGAELIRHAMKQGSLP